MSLDAIIRRADGQPLGSIEQVQQKLKDAFPGVQFAIEQARGDAERGALMAFLSLMGIKIRKTEYPYHAAQFQGRQFAAEFNLGAGPTVREVQVTLYGRGTPEATPHFAKLTRRPGGKWSIDSAY